LVWGAYDPKSPDEAWDLREDNEQLAGVLKQRGYAVAGGQFPEGAGWSTWNTRTGDLLEALFPAGSADSD
jgi:hypothetical protein